MPGSSTSQVPSGSSTVGHPKTPAEKRLALIANDDSSVTTHLPGGTARAMPGPGAPTASAKKDRVKGASRSWS